VEFYACYQSVQLLDSSGACFVTEVLGALEHDPVPNHSEVLGNFSLHSVSSPMLTYEFNDPDS
jgi:hypothetical protein